MKQNIFMYFADFNRHKGQWLNFLFKARILTILCRSTGLEAEYFTTKYKLNKICEKLSILLRTVIAFHRGFREGLFKFTE